MLKTRPLVSLVRGMVDYDSVFKSLELIEPEISGKLSRSTRIVIKPDLFPGARASVDAMRALLDFISEFSEKKLTLAEGLFDGSSISPAFHDAGFHELADDYGIRFVDLNKDDFVPVRLGSDPLTVARGSNLSVRVASTMLNSDFRISLAMPRVVKGIFYGGLFNIALGGLISNGKGVGKNDKARLVSSTNWEKEMAEVLEVVRPSLSVLESPRSFSVASSDAVAADSVAFSEFKKKKIGKPHYLYVCSRAGLGSLSGIKVIEKDI